MKMKYLLFLALWLSPVITHAQKYVGGDLSLLPKYEAAGKKYYTNAGAEISDLITYCKSIGWNSVRVRLFVNPTGAYADGTECKDVCQDVDFVKAIGKRVKDAGMYFLLDFHYSDTYADPASQWTPNAWKNLSNNDLYTQIQTYTEDVLQTLVNYGAAPDAIQIGNEISYGMLWGTYNTKTYVCYTSSSTSNWTRFTTLLSRAATACRNKCPEAKIILHTERVAQTSVLNNFYDKMASAGVDYDVIGLSYYSQYHGNLTTLGNAINNLQNRYPAKEIWVVETAYSATGYNLPGDVSTDLSSTYPLNDTGQNNYTKDLIAKLNSYSKVKGLFWWMPEDNTYGSSTSVRSSSDGWWNGSLFNQSTGKARTALTTLATFLTEDTTEPENPTYTVNVNTLLSDGVTSSGSCYIKIWDSDWNLLSPDDGLGTQLSTLPTKTAGSDTYYYISVTPTTSSIYVILNDGQWGSGTHQTADLSYSADVWLTYNGTTTVTANDVTDIHNIYSGSPYISSQRIYTLDGRSVSSNVEHPSPDALPKGIYIMGGKKFVVR